MIVTGKRRANWSEVPAFQITIAATFLLLAAVLRLASFHRSVIDWDESLYFLIAEAWRQGHLPYTTLWDNKPIGIYAIFAGFQILFGDTISSMRWAAVVAVSTTAFCLYRLMTMLDVPEARTPLPIRVLPGVLYLCCSIDDGGMAANTELFFAPFTCLAMMTAWSRRAGRGRDYLAGLFLGLAILVKFVAVFEAPALLAAMMMRTRRGSLRRELRDFLLFGLGIVTPMICAFLLYLRAADGHLFLTANLLDNLHRLDMPFSMALAGDALHDHAERAIALYLAAALLPIHLLVAWWRRRAMPVVPFFLLLWIIGAFVGTASAKSFYNHYFLQPLPALCFATVWLSTRLGSFRNCLAAFATTALLLVQPLLGARSAIEDTLAPVRLDQPGIGWLRDEPARIAVAMRPALQGQPDVRLYVFDAEPILYSLTGATPPTRYAFPSFIISRFLSRVAGVDPEAEFRAVMARDPLFVVCSRLRHPVAARDNLAIYQELARRLHANYEIWEVFPSTTVYRYRSNRNSP